MAENFLNKAKDTAKNVSDKLKGIDNEKAQQASEQIDKYTGGSDEENKDGENKDEENKDEK
ncbi:MAG TPA: hypothetical protein VK115_07630 [Staphylococcus sp.]|nr:hypothetical protein [Staphylococcus sp.]